MNNFDRDTVNAITKRLTKGSKHFAFACTMYPKGPELTHSVYIDGTEFKKDSSAEDSEGKGTPIAATELFEKTIDMVNEFSEKSRTKFPSYIVLNFDSMYNEIYPDSSDPMFANFSTSTSKIFVLSYAMDFSDRTYLMTSSMNLDSFVGAAKVNSKDKRLITTESSIADTDSFIKFLLQID